MDYARKATHVAKDLIGKKVAVLEGGLAQLYMAIWLEQNGVRYDQVEYVNLIMDDAASAMIGGDVDAAEFWDPFGPNLMKVLSGSHELANSREPFWLKSALIADSVFMNKKFIAERNDVALKTMQALYDAIEWWSKNPTEGNKIIAEAREKFPIIDATCVHRVGLLEIGDIAVWVGVSSGHRGEAFDACRYIIDEIKHRTPIWKKEFYTDGHSGWVRCENCVAPGHTH